MSYCTDGLPTTKGNTDTWTGASAPSQSKPPTPSLASFYQTMKPPENVYLIARIACKIFGVAEVQFWSRSRMGDLPLARQVAIVAASNGSQKTNAVVAAWFGYNVTAVSHAKRRLYELRKSHYSENINRALDASADVW